MQTATIFKQRGFPDVDFSAEQKEHQAQDGKSMHCSKSKRTVHSIATCSKPPIPKVGATLLLYTLHAEVSSPGTSTHGDLFTPR